MAAIQEKDTNGALSTQAVDPEKALGPSSTFAQDSTDSPSSDEVEITYPEGGPTAWLCVFGSFLTMMATFGFMNAIGALSAMLHAERLSDKTEGEIGWIFGIYVALCFAGGLIVGPIFDLYGPTWLMITGCIGMAASYLLASFSSQFWQFILVLGFLMGIMHSLIFTPSTTAIGHYFLEKRGLATGLAISGGSVGGITFTLLLRHLDVKFGFAWSIRIVGIISIALIAVGCFLVRGRDFYALSNGLSEKSGRPKFSFKLVYDTIDIRSFKDPTFALTTAGIFMIEWALFAPVTYLTTFALSMKNLEPDLAYQLIAIMNTGSFFGRALPGLVADRMGRFNTLVATIIICTVTSFALWLPAWYARDESVAVTKGLLISFALLYGFGSGSGISLTPVCVGQISETKDYGKRYGTCYFFVSFGVLTGIPIAGEIINRGNGDFAGLILFTGFSYALACLLLTAARISHGGWNWKAY